MSELLSEGEEERKYKKQAREIMGKARSALPADQAQLYEKQGEGTGIDALLQRYLEELGDGNVLLDNE